jgi:hypothetical protein
MTLRRRGGDGIIWFLFPVLFAGIVAVSGLVSADLLV